MKDDKEMQKPSLMLTATTNLGVVRNEERGGSEDVERTLQLSLSVKSHQAL